MAEKKQQRLIEHPDELVEGKRYTVAFKDINPVGRPRKVTGRFLRMYGEYCPGCGHNHLTIVLEGKSGTRRCITWWGDREWFEL